MPHRYSIMVRSADTHHKSELAQVDSNPTAIAEAARERFRWVQAGDRRYREPLYEHVWVVDNLTGETV